MFRDLLKTKAFEKTVRPSSFILQQFIIETESNFVNLAYTLKICFLTTVFNQFFTVIYMLSLKKIVML